MPLKKYESDLYTFTQLPVGACFEFDPDYAGERWPGLLKKTGKRTFRDVDTGESGRLRRPSQEPVDDRLCPVLAGKERRRRRTRTKRRR